MLQWIRQFKKNKKTRTHSASLLVIVFLFFFLSAQADFAVFSSPVFAQGDTFGLQPIEGAIGLSSVDIRLIVMQVIRAALGLLGVIALVLILYAGYMIMTSAGEEEKITTGKRILTNAVIGLAIILSAFAIVQFILNQLAGATGFLGFGLGGGGTGSSQTFAGSGALGRMIKDHYPFRDQTGVVRNTKIAVTFREPIAASSVIDDTNNSGVFGDCVPPAGQPINVGRDCDRIKTNAVQLFVRPEAGAPRGVAPAYLPASAFTVASERADGKVVTFVFQPVDPLGSDRQDMWYTVKLTRDIKKADGTTGAFVNMRECAGCSDFYTWDFQTNTQFDYAPPKVISVFPDRPNPNAVTVSRNAIVQINFSEPVDPTMVQGHNDPASPFTNIIFGDTDGAVRGSWKITNEYRTVEFVSDDACGQNTCGETMYCLPRPAAAGGTRDETVLVRTARLLSAPPSAGTAPRADAFQALPFSGVMDMAGNALDGGSNPDSRPEGQPCDSRNSIAQAACGDLHTMIPAEKTTDNVFWQFFVDDSIERTAPYIRTVEPTIDAEDVPRTDPVKIVFSSPLPSRLRPPSNAPMWVDSLDAIAFVEHPSGGAVLPTERMWKRVRATRDATTGATSGETTAIVEHREFGPGNSDVYYFPTVPSTVKNSYQNCFYPGRGPKRDTRTSPVPGCVYTEDAQTGAWSTNGGCVLVNRTPATDTGCMQTSRTSAWLQPNLSKCATDISPPAGQDSVMRQVSQ